MTLTELREALSLEEDVDILCEWFAMCANTATALRNHPIIGQVPICDDCATRANA